MLPTIKANLIVAGLLAVEKAEQIRNEAARTDGSAPVGAAKAPRTAVTYATNANGSEITLKDEPDQGLGSQLDCSA